MKFKKKISNKNEEKIKTRKELRKEKRQEKKQKKNEYFANRKLNKIENFKKNKPEKENVDSRIIEQKEGKKHLVPLETTQSMLEKQRNEEKQMQKKIQMGSKTVRKKHLISANQDEDKEIKRLEKLLNMNKRKSKKIPSSFVSDGLDYLLELCDSEKRKEISEYESQTRLSEAESDFEQDLAEVTGRKAKKPLKKKVKQDDEDSSDSENSDADFESEEDFDDKPLEMKIKRSQTGKRNATEENSNCSENYSDVESGDFEEEFDDESNDEEFDSENDVDDDDVEIDNIDEESDDFDNANNENNEFKGFDSDDSIHESDFDEVIDMTDDENSESEQENTNMATTMIENKEKAKKLSKEERMKALMGFVNKETSKKKKYKLE
uniref:Nucleolar MIF4G domain-containing protein 1 n=1 Tax=Cacopsylla melanoneura TaxID=428564 RepID=A0A8D9ETS5_9HEMI